LLSNVFEDGKYVEAKERAVKHLRAHKEALRQEQQGAYSAAQATGNEPEKVND
jgi:hypothetical protein